MMLSVICCCLLLILFIGRIFVVCMMVELRFVFRYLCRKIEFSIMWVVGLRLKEMFDSLSVVCILGKWCLSLVMVVMVFRLLWCVFFWFVVIGKVR